MVDISFVLERSSRHEYISKEEDSGFLSVSSNPNYDANNT